MVKAYKKLILNAYVNKILGFIRMDMRGCRTSARTAGDQGLVRATLEYACTAWDPRNNMQMEQLEKVHRGAAVSAKKSSLR